MDENRIRGAIELLQRQICILEEKKDYDEYGQPLYDETLDIAIEQYNLAIEALEKQLPKKVEELKKCPFCGGEADLIETLCLSNNFKGYLVMHVCDMVTAPIETHSFLTKEQAIEAWNRRMEE